MGVSVWLWERDSLVVLLVDDVEDVVFMEGELGVWVLWLVVVEGLCDCDVGHGAGRAMAGMKREMSGVEMETQDGRRRLFSSPASTPPLTTHPPPTPPDVPPASCAPPPRHRQAAGRIPAGERAEAQPGHGSR